MRTRTQLLFLTVSLLIYWLQRSQNSDSKTSEPKNGAIHAASELHNKLKQQQYQHQKFQGGGGGETSTRQHILIISKSQVDPYHTRKVKELRNTLTIVRILDTLRFKYTLYSVTNQRQLNQFPSLIDKNNPMRGRFSLVKKG